MANDSNIQKNEVSAKEKVMAKKSKQPNLFTGRWRRRQEHPSTDSKTVVKLRCERVKPHLQPTH